MFLLALLAEPAPLRAAPQLQEITLAEAIARALDHAPALARAQGSVDVASALQRAALGAYLPSLTAHATGSTGSRTLTSADRWRLDAGLSASWKLFTGFRRGAEDDAADAAAQAASAGNTQSAAEVALAVQQAFYEGLRAKELAVVAAQRTQRAVEGADAARRKASAGAATRSDVLRAELELNTARQAVLQVEAEQRASAYLLGRLVGADGPVAPAALQESPPADASAHERLVEELVDASPAVHYAQASLARARAERRAARSPYWPALTLGAGYDWTSATAALMPDATSWNVGLTLSYSLFDGFARDQALTAASVEERVAQAELDDARREIRTQAAQAVDSLRLAAQRITLAEEAVAVAAADLQAQDERYAMGVTTMLELLSSRTALVEVQRDLIDARFEQRLAQAVLKALAGALP